MQEYTITKGDLSEDEFYTLITDNFTYFGKKPTNKTIFCNSRRNHVHIDIDTNTYSYGGQTVHRKGIIDIKDFLFKKDLHTLIKTILYGNIK